MNFLISSLSNSLFVYFVSADIFESLVADL